MTRENWKERVRTGKGLAFEFIVCLPEFINGNEMGPFDYCSIFNFPPKWRKCIYTYMPLNDWSRVRLFYFVNDVKWHITWEKLGNDGCLVLEGFTEEINLEFHNLQCLDGKKQEDLCWYIARSQEPRIDNILILHVIRCRVKSWSFNVVNCGDSKQLYDEWGLCLNILSS